MPVNSSKYTSALYDHIYPTYECIVSFEIGSKKSTVIPHLLRLMGTETTREVGFAPPTLPP